MLTKILLLIFLGYVYSFHDASVPNQAVNFNSTQYSIQYDLTSGFFNVLYNNVLVISNAYSLVYNGNMALNSTAYASHTLTQINFNDNFGSGICYTVTSNSDTMPQMQQNYYVYSGQTFFFTEVYINGTQLKSNYMAPLVSNYVNLNISGDIRALFVPFDNDAFIRYNVASELNITSSEVSAIYDNLSRKGIITGSIEHDTWKTGVRVLGSGMILNELNVFGGYTDKLVTRDQMAHGSISGSVIKSPKVFVGYYDDWRQGLEDYAKANRYANPKYIFDWTQPVPFGWNSWGSLREEITLPKLEAVVDFFADELTGFRSGNTAYIDIDSGWWFHLMDGLTGNYTELKQFADYAKSKGLQPGAYFPPFTDWNKTARSIENSTTWNYQDTWLTQNGSFHDFDNGRSMDPTHPGTQHLIAYAIGILKTCGFKMIKIDFLGHAAIEADHFYDPTVTTGMQAFKKGMEYLDDQLAGEMLVYAAISPNFGTASYVHMRRISCDAHDTIQDTEYEMNSLNYGWWLTYLYNYVDADTLEFGDDTEGTNRARFTSGVVTGTLITGDDYSNPSASLVDCAKRILQNQQILDISRQSNGKSFRPVEGNTGSGASNLYVKPLGKYFYLAVFNFNSTQEVYNVSLNRIGLTDNHYTGIELYSNNSVVFDKTGNLVTLDGPNAAIFKFNICPDGWILSSIDNTTCYMVGSDTDTWQNAQDKCQTHEASLVSIDSAFENNQIAGLVTSACDAVYIGLYNIGNNGWVWINGDKSTYRNWQNGYPSNNASNTVAVLNQNSSRWTNEYGSIPHCYICKMMLKF